MSSPAKTNVLLIGSGGREHALAWQLRKSPTLGELYTDSPSNPGLAALARPTSARFNPKDTFELEQFCTKQRIGLVVVGPEEPLAQGIADALLGTRSNLPQGVRMPEHLKAAPAGAVPFVFGPLKAAAQLEADKSFAKDLMRSAAIPTAEAKSFTDPETASNYLRSRTDRPVLKASGLCKGKGVFLPDSLEEALSVVERIMVKREFGDAGRTLVIEERLKGREVSVFAITDGRTLMVLDACQDHKRLLDGAKGPNTGGMGACCPTRAIDERTLDRIQREVLVPTIDALRREGIEYRGVLYAGLMLTPGGPKVLEFNVRFGDPECQTLMMRFEGDLLQVLLAAAGGPTKLDRVECSFARNVAVCVVMAAPGYPDDPRSDVPINNLDAAAKVQGVQIFHAATKRRPDGQLVSAGGRVLNVCAVGTTHDEARARAYEAVRLIDFPGAIVRTDIGTEVVG
jgi:phosphoribosylamine--glycine ligase